MTVKKKIILLILSVSLLLLLVPVGLSLLLQVQGVQNFIVHQIIEQVNKRIQGSISLSRIGITMPGAIVLDELLINDSVNDTIIHAGTVRVRLKLTGLLRGQVKVRSLRLSDCTVNIIRQPGAPGFNIQQLFSTTPSDAVAPREKKAGKKSLPIDVGRVRLNTVRFLLFDRESGVRVETSVGRLAIRMERINLDSLIFGIHDIELDRAFCGVGIYKKGKTRRRPTKPPHLPLISFKKLSLTNAAFGLNDTIAKTVIDVGAEDIRIENGDVDIIGRAISAHSLAIRGAEVDLGLTGGNPRPKDTVAKDSSRIAWGEWWITANSLDLSQSRFALDMMNVPRRKTGFNAAHMHYQNIAVKASDIFYSPRAIRAKLANVATLDTNTVDLKKCAVDFSMDEKGLTARNLAVTTTSSDIRASGTTGFSPFGTWRDSLSGLPVSVQIKPSRVSTSEIRSFMPAFAEGPVLFGDDKSITLSGTVNGTVGSLRGEKIRVSYGDSTELRADFRIRGLPAIKKAHLSVTALNLITIKDDVESLLGKSFLPRDLSLPGQLLLDGSFSGTMHAFQSTLTTTLDDGSMSAKVTLDGRDRYTAAIDVDNINPGRIYRKLKTIGAVKFTATLDGKGFDPATLSAAFRLDAPSLQIDNRVYRSVSANIRADSQRYNGTLSVQDEDLNVTVEGSAHVAKGHEAVRCRVDLKEADFFALGITQDSLRVSCGIDADLKGRSIGTLNGRLGVSDLALRKGGVDYRMDSLLCAMATSPQGQIVTVRSQALDARYEGTVPVDKAFTELGRRILRSLPLEPYTGDSVQTVDRSGTLSLDLAIYDHPLLNALLPSDLRVLEGVKIKLDYSGTDNRLNADARVLRGEYKGVGIRDVHATVNAGNERLAYSIAADNVVAGRVSVTDVHLRGTSTGERATLTVSAKGKERNGEVIYAKVSAERADSALVLALDPSRFFLMGYPWVVNGTNRVRLQGKHLAVSDLTFSRERCSVAVSSANTPVRDKLTVAVRNFDLGVISRMIETDTMFIRGMLDADLGLSLAGERSSVHGRAGLRDIVLKNVPVGSLSLVAETPETGVYRIMIDLIGQGNDARIQGTVATDPAKREIDITADIQNLMLHCIEPFTGKAVSRSKGSIQGVFSYRQARDRPTMNGNISFHDASFVPAMLNSTIRLGNEPLAIRNGGIRFNNFSIRDQKNHTARFSGLITADSAGIFEFDLKASAANFILLNTTERDNRVVYGRLIVDWQASVGGTSRLPVIVSRVVLKAPSSMTFAVPETGVKTDRGEHIVVFAGADSTVEQERPSGNGTIKGIELTSEIEVDQGVTLRLIPDPSTQDALVVKGDAALNLGLDKSGKMSLTGTYRLSDGSYTMTLPPLPQKKFTILSGSTLRWNGDPVSANAAIVAQYAVSAAPFDLVKNQIPLEGQSDFRKPLRFDISLNFNGPLLRPDIAFALDLAPADKGAHGGLIDARLAQINQDPTALNKQVFGLLVLGSFISENPLDQSGATNQLSSVARSSVSGFLASQLNQWGASLLPGFQFNVGLQSYDNTEEGQTVGKTTVDLGVKKQLFNDRLSVEVGGVFDVQGDRENQNTAREGFGGNVAVEYKLTPDGRYSLKGFRQQQYESVIDGQLTKTGVGVVYNRNFDYWRHLFTSPRKKGKKQDEQ